MFVKIKTESSTQQPADMKFGMFNSKDSIRCNSNVC